MHATDPLDSPANRTPPTRREILDVASYALAYCAVLLVINVALGTAGIPRGDDWAASANTFGFVEQSRFVLNGWLQMFFLGQAVLAWPFVRIFGESLIVLQILVLFLAGAGLVLCHLVLRTFLSQRASLVAVAVLALGPVYGTAGFGFATDVPAFAFQMASLLAGWQAVRQPRIRWGWFAASLGLATWGFCIREYSVVAGLAVTAIAARQAWVTRRESDDAAFPRVLALGGVWLGSLIWLFAWRGGLPISNGANIDLSAEGLRASGSTLWSIALSAGVFVLPAALIVSPVRLVRTARRDCPGTLLAIVAGIVMGVVLRPELVGNFFTPTGAFSQTVSGYPIDLVPRWAWNMVVIGAAYGLATGLLTAAMVARSLGARSLAAFTGSARDETVLGRDLVVAFVGLFVLVNAAIVLGTDSPYFDRYLIALVPFAAGLVVWAARRLDLLVGVPDRVGVWALGATALVGVLFVTNTSAFEGGKWRLAERVEARGYAAAMIDGGFEWFSHHQSDTVFITPAPFDPTPMQGGFWRWIFTPRTVCVTIVMGRTPGEASGNEDPPLIDTLEVDPILGPSYRLYAFAGPAQCTPSPRAGGS